MLKKKELIQSKDLGTISQLAKSILTNQCSSIWTLKLHCFVLKKEVYVFLNLTHGEIVLKVDSILQITEMLSIIRRISKCGFTSVNGRFEVEKMLKPHTLTAIFLVAKLSWRTWRCNYRQRTCRLKPTHIAVVADTFGQNALIKI